MKLRTRFIIIAIIFIVTFTLFAWSIIATIYGPQ